MYQPCGLCEDIQFNVMPSAEQSVFEKRGSVLRSHHVDDSSAGTSNTVRLASNGQGLANLGEFSVP